MDRPLSLQQPLPALYCQPAGGSSRRSVHLQYHLGRKAYCTGGPAEVAGCCSNSPQALLSLLPLLWVCRWGPGARSGLGSPALFPAGLGAHFQRRQRVLWLKPHGNGHVAGSRPRALTRGRSLPHSQRKQARELLAALQKVVVPIYCTSFLAVEEDKQQKIARVRGGAGRGAGRAETGGTAFPADRASPSCPASSFCSSGRRTATLMTPSSSSYRARP